MPGSFLPYFRFRRLIPVLLFLCPLFYHPAIAQFPINPDSNVAISTAFDGQSDPIIVSDGAGGAIIAWVDLRTGQGMDVYAQHIDASGIVQWSTDGIAICAEPGIQDGLGMVSDSSGGAILVWEDKRTDMDYDIYAQRISSSGTAMWSAGGTPISVTDGDQQSPAIVADGKGGAIIVWCDTRSGRASDIYAQRVDASGNAQWAQNGFPVLHAEVSSTFIIPALAGDGSHGAFVGWEDIRNPPQRDIWLQRIDSAGTSRWDPAGVAACDDSADQSSVVLVADGAGGVIACWTDFRTQFRNGTFGDDGIYAQRMDASGTARWTKNGITVNDTVSTQENPVILSDGSGGAIVCWVDFRRGDYDVYAQKLDSTGALKWISSGVPLCVADGDQSLLRAVPDGAGGAFVSWSDTRTGDQDIYVQKINSSGTPQWALNGVAVTSATGPQYSSAIALTTSKGAIVTWTDERTLSADIYAQNVDAGGSLGLAPQLLSPNNGAGIQADTVRLSWTRILPAASKYWLDVASDSLFTFRSSDSTITDTAHTVGNLAHAQTYWWRVRGYDNGWGPFSAARKFSITLTGVEESEGIPKVFNLAQNFPNPFNPTTVVTYQLPVASNVELTIFDVLGQEVARLVHGRKPAGSHQATFDASGLASGIYIYRLTAGSFVQSRKMVLLK